MFVYIYPVSYLCNYIVLFIAISITSLWDEMEYVHSYKYVCEHTHMLIDVGGFSYNSQPSILAHSPYCFSINTKN